MSWPSYAEIAVPGFRVEPDRNIERTTFEDGMVRQERRYPGALQAVRFTALIDDDDLANFRTWARDNAHAWFDFPTPLATGDVRARVRGGAGGIQYAEAPAGAGRIRWQATMVLEGTDL